MCRCTSRNYFTRLCKKSVVSFISTAGLYDLTVANFFIVLLVVVVASLGIAGVPGTASVVTAGVLGGIGLGTLYVPVYAIIGSLDGLFDMGRTAVNVAGDYKQQQLLLS
ncbi:cation:dicarboxylate symporter family transporter [Spiroplasma sp. ald]|uniref:cation:dicarboxylate symporter family transporter n=1 Tax=Spiroplasma sp. ald TaxID=2490849 RepID=UPI0037DC3C99